MMNDRFKSDRKLHFGVAWTLTSFRRIPDRGVITDFSLAVEDPRFGRARDPHPEGDVRTRKPTSQPGTWNKINAMWQRFTEGARKAVFFAQEEAQNFGEGYVSTEHLLLGILREEGVATRVLRNVGIDPGRVRKEVETQMGVPEKRPSIDMTLTPRAKHVIDLAYDEARNLDHSYIGCEHLLLGLVREGDGLGGRVLLALGADLRTVREAVAVSLGQEPPKSSTTVEALSRLSGPKTPPQVKPAAMASYLTAMMLGIRQRQLGPDLIVLILLANPPKELDAGLRKLGVSAEMVQNAIEQAILQAPYFEKPTETTPALPWPDRWSDPARLFVDLATTPTTFTHRALQAMEIDIPKLRRAFEE